MKKIEMKRHQRNLQSRRYRRRLNYLRKMRKLGKFNISMLTAEELKNKDKILKSIV